MEHLPTPAETSRTLRRPDGQTIRFRVMPASGPTRGHPVVLLHGLASNLTRWSEFVEHSALRERHDLIRIDLRGHGGSDVGGPIGMEVWADDLAALLDQEGHAQAILVGHSLGAQLALHFARRHAHRARALVLIDPVFREALTGRRRLLPLGAPVLRGLALLVRALNALGLRRRRLKPLDLRELDEQARRALQSADAEAAFVRRYSSARADLRSTRSVTYLSALAEMFRASPDPATLAMPVLALLSGGATFADPALMRRRLARAPNLTLATIECQHWPLTERPVEVRSVIERWVNGLAH